MDSYQINLCQLAQRNFGKRLKKNCLKQNGNGREKKVVGDIRKKMYRTEKEKRLVNK